MKLIHDATLIATAKANAQNHWPESRWTQVRISSPELVDLVNEKTTHGGRHDGKDLLRRMASGPWTLVCGLHVYRAGGGNRTYATVRLNGKGYQHIYLDRNGCVSGVTRGSRKGGEAIRNRIRPGYVAPGAEPPM